MVLPLAGGSPVFLDRPPDVGKLTLIWWKDGGGEMSHGGAEVGVHEK